MERHLARHYTTTLGQARDLFAALAARHGEEITVWCDMEAALEIVETEDLDTGAISIETYGIDVGEVERAAAGARTDDLFARREAEQEAAHA